MAHSYEAIDGRLGDARGTRVRGCSKGRSVEGRWEDSCVSKVKGIKLRFWREKEMDGISVGEGEADWKVGGGGGWRRVESSQSGRGCT
jgi:hypothetical protein